MKFKEISENENEMIRYNPYTTSMHKEIRKGECGEIKKIVALSSILTELNKRGIYAMAFKTLKNQRNTTEIPLKDIINEMINIIENQVEMKSDGFSDRSLI